MTISRRTFFRGALLVATASPVLSGCSLPFPGKNETPPRPLPIPPLLEGTAEGKARVYRLRAQSGTAEILAGVPGTRTWGFNGDFLGPTLRVRKGEKVRVEINNGLPEMTTVHWHGMKLPAKSDGGPHSPIEPGATWKPEWEIIQPAATLWYHPHPHMATSFHAYRGLAGMIIVDDEVSDAVDLPREYGVDDIPVVIGDVKFTEDNQLDESMDPVVGLLGTTPIINGIANAGFTATTRRVRLRLLNATSMRFYTLALSNDRPLQVVGTDCGLLDRPLEADNVLIGPGERVEVVVDLEPGKEVTLQSVPQDGNSLDFGFQDRFDLLRITGPESSAPQPGPLPQTLAADAASTPPLDDLKVREFVLNGHMINGWMLDLARVDVTIDHDKPEIWKVSNANVDWPHNFHIHNARFKVIDFEAKDTMKVVTSGWKDTIDLPPRSVAMLLVEFGHFPDPTTPYMFHCHLLLHEDLGMMGQFVMVNKGQKPHVEVSPETLAFGPSSSMAMHHHG